MRKSLLSLATAAALLAGVGLAQAQTATATTTTVWTNDQGTVLRAYSTSKKYADYDDATMVPTVGMELPAKVTVYALPDTMKMQPTEHYSYTIINHNPVVVDTTTRKIVHTWQSSGQGSAG